MKRNRKRVKPAKPGDCYRQFHRVIDGAIRDAFQKHPDYLTPKGARQNTARRSISKRVTGALIGWVEQSTQRRSGQGPAPALAVDLARADCLDEVPHDTSSPRVQTSAASGPLGYTEARP